MKCPNCGSEFKPTDSFCKVCRAPLEKYKNSSFYRAEVESKPPEPKVEKTFSLKREIDVIKNIISDEPLRDPNTPLENKDLIKKDTNNRQKATIINFLELAGILVVLWIVVKIIMDLLLKL